MRFLTIITFSLLAVRAYAFTLLYPNPPRFANHNIVIRIIKSDCANAGLTADEVKVFVQKAVDTYWNTVTTSNAKFQVGDFIDVGSATSVNDMLDVIPDNEIIAGCVDDPGTFSDPGTLAVGVLMPTGAARGVVALNDTTSTEFPIVSAINQRAVFAHELGHAIGLGHTSASQALMYYAVGPTISRKHLAEDDADAITYLYPDPQKEGGLGGACGQIAPFDSAKGGPGTGTLALHLAACAAMLGLFKFLRRRQHS